MNEPIVIEMSKYIKPVIKEEMGKDWVLNGRNNHFWDYILDRYNGSPTNSAIIDAYVDRIYGKGLSIKNSKSNASELLKVLTVLNPKEALKIVWDYETFGSAVGQIRYAKSSERRIAKIEHLERKHIAPAKLNYEGEIDRYWFCTDWKKAHQLEPVSY
ncbi:MAG: hypothetical protein AAF985_19275, partial [Bacteroidota bacterium]